LWSTFDNGQDEEISNGECVALSQVEEAKKELEELLDQEAIVAFQMCEILTVSASNDDTSIESRKYCVSSFSFSQTRQCLLSMPLR
jgi:hypothetical protein